MKTTLKVQRAIHDMTQEDLANKVGVTRQTINAIEKQKYDPSLSLAFKLARLFDVRIEEIFLYEKE
jgi:putative transcriptional regulator